MLTLCSVYFGEYDIDQGFRTWKNKNYQFFSPFLTSIKIGQKIIDMRYLEYSKRPT